VCAAGFMQTINMEQNHKRGKHQISRKPLHLKSCLRASVKNKTSQHPACLPSLPESARISVAWNLALGFSSLNPTNHNSHITALGSG
jgi:hypothetical protein